MRLARVSWAFTIIGVVGSNSVGVDLMRGLLFKKLTPNSGKVEIDRAVKSFVRRIRAFHSTKTVTNMIEIFVKAGWLYKYNK